MDRHGQAIETVGWVERSDTHNERDGYRNAQPILQNYPVGCAVRTGAHMGLWGARRTPRAGISRSIMGVQGFVQLDRRFVGLALHCAGLRVAAEQQVRLASQIAGLEYLDQFVVSIEQCHLGAGSDVQAGLHGVAVAQWDADTGVGADQAAFAHRNHDITATGQGAHGRAAAAQVRALAYEYARRNAAFDHAWAGGASVEVDEAFVHHGGAFTHASAWAPRSRSFSGTCPPR